MTAVLRMSSAGTAMNLPDPLASLTNPPPCPRCGLKMRLARIEPQPAPNGFVEQVTYDCSCGQLLTAAVGSRDQPDARVTD